MRVCIAEKPSVAREIASVLGANTKHDGYYEGNGYVVTYTFGHLCTLKEPNDYKSYWKSWDLNNLPMLPEKFETKVVENSGIQKQFKIIKSLFDKAELVINCGDAGQEGELIQRWVMNEAQYKGEVKRLWISSLTTEAIKEGFENLKPSANYDNLYYAGFSRAIGDWLLGMNATRLYTVKHGGYKQVLSIGRVQTPTLAMVVDRFAAIENFKPQTYWELQTLYRETLFSYEEGRFLKKEDGEILANKVKESDFEIVSVEKKNGNEFAPKLFDLTGLQVYCNTKFGFSADETLKIVQTLYEQKVVTYPRVDTTFLPNDIYPKVPGILQKLTNYAALTEPLLEKKIKKSAKVFNDKKVTDHHAIIPTGIQTNLQYNQQQVYDIITKRFIAVFYDDCLVANTTVIGKAADVAFKTTGKEILKKGFRIVFDTSSPLSTNAKEKEADILPSFVQGEKGPHEPSFLEKETKPPNQFTEATLLRAMETAGKQVDDEDLRELMKENGIGRPSTRANIIETLFRRQYIVRNKKQVLPTPTGIQLIDTIQNDLVKSAELTGSWEKQLKDIEKGTFTAAAFINNMKRMVEALVYEVRSETRRANISHAGNIQKQEAIVEKKKAAGILAEACPKCKKATLIKGKSAYGCGDYKAGCTFLLPYTFAEKKISENQYLRLLQKGSTVNLKDFKTDSGAVEGLLRFDENFKLKLEPKKIGVKATSDALACPKCKKGTVMKGKTAYGCGDYKSGCDFKVPFEVVRAKLKDQKPTKELVYTILKESI
ncbi:DNA topoisomerase 3 [Flavobacterium gawalongense]|uniref:DNA topoisomerase n=1 Tax=Flavobacterium gawalongense TaxID=2594432 RepID=A0A553BCJ4_9FLAO|nr:DNA topoisomerase 3 [Flavobacterium gawalongense]TRX00979.1 DNA topoisomerase III [Flavobacterium gawalongense]TRX05482.1 DNA topoisomerase III [Flavobacterium gawalongense]TRX05974.1 DNA topoisomerase III [Flavobacterium gawalongense]TRX07081.1 DNA topoisomerase III [Flavobacterium gawalongense]TRX23200.1 DNA topoisomerase III [Flavobacterium gawalongense]